MLDTNEPTAEYYHHLQVPLLEETDILIISGGSAGSVVAIAAHVDDRYNKSVFAISFNTLERHDSTNGLFCEYDYKEYCNLLPVLVLMYGVL